MRLTTILALFLITACAPGEITGTTLPDAPTRSAAPGQEASPIPVTLATGAPLTASSGSLWLQIISPLDEAVVNASQIEIVGMAPPDTVISINDEFLLVGPEEQFTLTVSLEEGPNLFEILASNLQGDEIFLMLTVVYEPE